MKEIRLIVNERVSFGFEKFDNPVISTFSMGDFNGRLSKVLNFLFTTYHVNGGHNSSTWFYNAVLRDALIGGCVPESIPIPVRLPMSYAQVTNFIRKYFDTPVNRMGIFQYAQARALGQQIEMPEYTDNVVRLSELMNSQPYEALELCVKDKIPYSEWIDYEKQFSQMVPDIRYPSMQDVVQVIPDLRERIDQAADKLMQRYSKQMSTAYGFTEDFSQLEAIV